MPSGSSISRTKQPLTSDPTLKNPMFRVLLRAEPLCGRLDDKWHQVVILQPPPTAPLPAFAGDNVKVPMTYGEANYFCRRKITMVNGMHTTLAFMTLCK